MENICPTTGKHVDDCQCCTGEFCNTHGTDLCECDSAERHDYRRLEFQGIPLTKDRPKIVTLCGSSRFAGHMAVMAWEFEKQGWIALGLHLLPDDYCKQKGYVPDEHGHIHHIGEQEGVENEMDFLHFKKIEISDYVYVMNIGGYIGSSTAREIAYAEHIGKPVGYYEDVRHPAR